MIREQMPQPGFYHQDMLVSVLTAQPLDRLLDYKAPEGGCHAGAFVQVPLGPRKVIGVVWGPGRGGFDISKARSITRVLDAPPMREELRQFLTRAADYTITPLSAMLRLTTRAPGLSDPPSMRKVYRLGTTPPQRLTDARKRVIEALDAHPGLSFTLAELAQLAEVSPSVIKGLAQQGAVLEQDSPRDLPYPPLQPNFSPVTLTPDQAKASAALRQAVQGGGYGCTLLKGVTGSGKTEVYLEAVAECVKQGRQALVLLPEIALTADFIARVQGRFGVKPGEWHSGIPLTERRRLWKMTAEGGVQLVVGARSALFLPFRELGLVVVDEEHDSSYKQEEGVLYNARDMAVLRGAICGAQVVLASATPSLESWSNAREGKYQRLELSSRYGTAQLPQMRSIDLRQEDIPAGRWISPTLLAAIQTRIEAGEQSLLFINRRGYAPTTVCRACGHQIGCDHCDARMVEHRFQNRLMCHQCGETKPMPQACPECGVAGKLAPVGPGVERLAEEVNTLFPEAKIAVLSSDLFGSARALKARIGEIAAGAYDIIIGTQMVAKGHNFPNLTLVGVIDTDLGLQGSDLRAAERSFQLIRQVAGRAGRSGKQGLALLQTHQPEHPVIRAILSGEEEAFWQAEADQRRMAGMPPFGRMAGIILSSERAEEVFELGEEMARRDGPLRRISAALYGPAPAPIAKIRGRFRVRLLVQAEKGVDLQGALRAWVGQFRLPNSVRLAIDIDPQSFL